MLYLYLPDQQAHYTRLFKEALPDWHIAVWPDEVNAEAVTHIAAWMPPEGFFNRFPNLQVVFALGAGVDRFLHREDLSSAITLIRLTDAGMAQQMTEYCLYGLLHYQRQMDRYQLQQKHQTWRPLETRLAKQTRVTILGLGKLGMNVAENLAQLGYAVTGWSRSPRQSELIQCVHGCDALNWLLPETDVLFSVLPATEETRYLLDETRLQLLPKDSAIINAGRGSLIDQQALLKLLNQDHFRFVLLDVFEKEPLDETHPFWTHPRVMITPHVAADTIAEEAVDQVASNIRALSNGFPVTGIVDRNRGY